MRNPGGWAGGGEERRGVGGRGIPKESLKTAQPCHLQQQDQHSLNLIPILLQMHGIKMRECGKKGGGGTSESARKKEPERARASSEVALSLSGWNGGGGGTH